jgi:predicted RNA binding protein YcfA (HicA-like mRNA interferase family)
LPRLPRVTAAQVVRSLERAGFVRVRSRGSHWVFRHAETRRRVIVPYHASRIIPLGTLSSILQQAGLTVEQLDELT